MSAKKTPTDKKKPAFKSYGRQAQEKTIKSLSLDKELASWAEKEAKKKGVSFSQFVSDLLAEEAGIVTGDVVPFPASMVAEGDKDPRYNSRLTEMPRQWIDMLGGLAAGTPITGHVMQEPIEVEKNYDSDHYALRVFGSSMEPKIKDGATIIVRRWSTEKGVPKKGTLVVWSDGTGSSLKEFGYRKAKADEEGDSMGNVPVLRSLNKAFPEVQVLEGGRIDAVFVEVL
ncbi:MAG: hypothetical protein EOP83_14800 [Verrucomicrobiaceae bacterium]|nr:MAG: hypothetical protein EOP83_14800 [Verrucomicrobiaceae bacterium]